MASADLAVSGGIVYVADLLNNRIDVFDPTNLAASFTSFSSHGSGSGQFNDGHGVAVSGGLVYVAEAVNGRIDRFDPSNFAGTFTSFGSVGSGPGQLGQPYGVAADGSGDIYVTDTFNNRIVQLAAVPEPSSLVLMATGVLLVLFAGKMRRRAGRARRRRRDSRHKTVGVRCQQVADRRGSC